MNVYFSPLCATFAWIVETTNERKENKSNWEARLLVDESKCALRRTDWRHKAKRPRKSIEKAQRESCLSLVDQYKPDVCNSLWTVFGPKLISLMQKKDKRPPEAKTLHFGRVRTRRWVSRATQREKKLSPALTHSGLRHKGSPALICLSREIDSPLALSANIITLSLESINRRERIKVAHNCLTHGTHSQNFCQALSQIAGERIDQFEEPLRFSQIQRKSEYESVFFRW